ncbi:hypothetical protein QA942_18090 [Streptomyces sp. B21-106]|uniref:hypothetical protein n=1 Tax=Streptomyces sp. B21-106 TaxID=3039418 RepID=UPI002FF01101
MGEVRHQAGGRRHHLPRLLLAPGDWFSVYDGKADGSSAVVDWEVGNRFGSIFNADGASTDRYKNKDFTESVTIRFRVCLGHWNTKLITAGTCSAGSATSPDENLRRGAPDAAAASRRPGAPPAPTARVRISSPGPSARSPGSLPRTAGRTCAAAAPSPVSSPCAGT